MALGSKCSILKVTDSKKREQGYRWVVAFHAEDNRRRKFFKRKTDAEDFAESREREAVEHGSSELSASERAAMLDLRDRLASCGGTVRAAIEEFCAKRESAAKSVNVETLVADLIAAKEREGTSKRYLQELR